jgi:hypothetical protein
MDISDITLKAETGIDIKDSFTTRTIRALHCGTIDKIGILEVTFTFSLPVLFRGF